MSISTAKKMKMLITVLRNAGRLLIAYSGGVDSTFLLRVARDVLGNENVMAVIARSETYPEREYREAVRYLRKEGIQYKVIITDELKLRGFRDNPVNRCYFCKKELFARLVRMKKRLRFNAVADGSTVDDLLDIRYGTKARDELGVISPLQQAGMTKQEIRNRSRALGLATHNKPSFACLASRFPHNSRITRKRLIRVDRAEEYIKRLGFAQVRVRDYGDWARIELYEKEMRRALEEATRKKIVRFFRTLGYGNITLDLQGYRTGSMNP